MSRNRHTCLVLGGGGSRGLSHLGALQVIERQKVPIHSIVGTSAGALVGAVYALELDALSTTQRALGYFSSDAFQKHPFKQMILKSKDVEQNFLSSLLSSIKRSYIFSNLLRKISIFPQERLHEVVADLLPDKTFADTKIPFAVPALDIESGEEVFITEGSLRQAVLASCSLPGFFPPVEMNGRLLADAGTIVPVPVTAAVEHFQADAAVAIDITSSLEQFPAEARGLDVILRVDAIACKRINEQELAKADVVLKPEVGARYWSDFSDFEVLVEEGVAAAEKEITALREISRRRGKGLWQRLASQRSH